MTDTGIGMSLEEQEAVHKLFEQQLDTVSIHDSTNMGLTLCARLARMMGGEIRLESTQGQGSSFIFNMPVKVAKKNGIRQKARSSEQSSAQLNIKRNPVILVVDDMPEMSHLIKIYFTNSPIKVLEAANREDCLQLALKEQPDLILMDLDLAGVDGRDVASQLKKDVATAHIPVVVMTGLMLEKDSCKPLFDDFLPKPFHLQELQRLVDNYIQLPKQDDGESSRTGEVFLPSDIDRIQAVWTQELEAFYNRAELSGHLDDALDLGQKMEEQGQKTDTAELSIMGRELKKFALDFDIRGVEQILTALQEITGKNG
ncbi:MAG: response regulator [Candidatus Electrothrix sp. AR3]|nr:response regulator [Candidatus Electrothrix sp. AR3]